MENGSGKLESDVTYIRENVAEAKVALNQLNGRLEQIARDLTTNIAAVDQKVTARIDVLDQRLTARIDAVDEKLTGRIGAADEKLTARIDAVDEKLTARSDAHDERFHNLAVMIERQFAELKVGRALDRVWWLLVCAAVLGVMAHGLKWI